MKIFITFSVILVVFTILLAIHENAPRWVEITIIFFTPISALILLRQIKQQEAK